MKSVVKGLILLSFSISTSRAQELGCYVFAPANSDVCDAYPIACSSSYSSNAYYYGTSIAKICDKITAANSAFDNLYAFTTSETKRADDNAGVAAQNFHLYTELSVANSNNVVLFNQCITNKAAETKRADDNAAAATHNGDIYNQCVSDSILGEKRLNALAKKLRKACGSKCSRIK